MRQNIRVDIIYYLCDTDFEMEFNLNGCCPMRMLTGKADDRGALVKNLAKAVQRSRVIMCCGPLFGGDGLVGLVSASIGHNTERVNCEEYGITTATDISIIEGSVPLVTPDGYFGGCIIESGPQTIILLSENRNIRKSLMNNLIHPYLEDISMIPDLAQRMRANSEKSKDNIVAPVPASVPPVNPEVEAEKAAADAAAIVAAALGETAAPVAKTVAEEVICMADGIEDISSSSVKENQPVKETVEEQEITPADMELEIEEETVSEQLSMDFNEEAEETAEEFISETQKEEIAVEEDVAEETQEAPINIEMCVEDEEKEVSEIIGMVPPEDDNLFATEEIEEEPQEEETEQEIQEEVEGEVEEEAEKQPTQFEKPRSGNSLFVADVTVEDNEPTEDQFMKTDYPEVELYVEPGAVTRKKMNDYAREYVPSKSDEMFLAGQDDDDYDYDYDFDKEKKKDSLNTTIIVLVIILFLILLILGYMLIYVPYSQDRDPGQYLNSLFGSAIISPFIK